jgi:hypothetical protein
MRGCARIIGVKTMAMKEEDLGDQVIQGAGVDGDK